MDMVGNEPFFPLATVTAKCRILAAFYYFSPLYACENEQSIKSRQGFFSFAMVRIFSKEVLVCFFLTLKRNVKKINKNL